MTSLTAPLRAGRGLYSFSRCALLQQPNRCYASMHDIYSGKKKLQELERSKHPLEESANSSEYSTVRELKSGDYSRTNQRYDEDSGVKPTKFQRYALVATRMYPTRASIPEYVGVNTIYRMGNRLRIAYITIGIVTCFIVFYTFESSLYKKILRDRVRLANKGPPE